MQLLCSKSTVKHVYREPTTHYIPLRPALLPYLRIRFTSPRTAHVWRAVVQHQVKHAAVAAFPNLGARHVGCDVAHYSCDPFHRLDRHQVYADHEATNWHVLDGHLAPTTYRERNAVGYEGCRRP